MNKDRTVVADVFTQKPLAGGGLPPQNGDAMEHRMTALETRFDTLLPTLATKTDIAELRIEIRAFANDTLKWMIATVIGLFLGFGGLFLAMSNSLKAVAQAPNPPIVIQVPSAAK